ncbi:hypothetical protein B0H11DRAFT_2345473 [Mycena galericulata]|nr:hypothetical protein B0H11DRAFT_2345473 [Mycena galericulata]
MGGSVNLFVKGLFSRQAITTMGTHERGHDRRGAAARQAHARTHPSGTLLSLGGAILKDDIDGGAKNGARSSNGGGEGAAVANEFRAALDTLFAFAMLDETQVWHVFCVNPNDVQLPNQLEGRSVKGQVRSTGLVAAARCAGVRGGDHPVVGKFCERYGAWTAEAGSWRAKAGAGRQFKMAYGVRAIVLGVHKVYLLQKAFHRLEDELWAANTEEQKRNRMRDAEVEGGLRIYNDPYAPYSSPQLDSEGRREPQRALGDSYAALPLIAHASPFQRADEDRDGAEQRACARCLEYRVGSRVFGGREPQPCHGRVRGSWESSWPTQILPPLPSIATRASAPPITRVCAWRPDSRAHAGSFDIPVLPLPLENASKSQSTPRDVLNPALAPDPLPCGWLRRSVRCSMRMEGRRCCSAGIGKQIESAVARVERECADASIVPSYPVSTCRKNTQAQHSAIARGCNFRKTTVAQKMALSARDGSWHIPYDAQWECGHLTFRFSILKLKLFCPADAR